MATTSLSDVDPVFVEVAKALYGEGVDARELWDVAKNADAADVHINGGLKVKKKPGHSNTSRALMLGAAAEGLGTFRAGQEAVKAVRPVKAGMKVLSTGSRAAKVGEFGLQAANLGVGVFAAHKLSQNAKKKQVVSKVTLKWLRPVKTVMTDAQATRHTAALKRTATMGDRVVAGGALAGAGVIGHRMGVKRGRKQAELAKGMLLATKTPPVAGVKPINSGGLSPGLGRHGRVIGGKTPHPKLMPVIRPPKLKPIVDNTVVKSLTWTGEISKVDTDKRTVFGWCSLSKVNGENVVDLQGDYVPLEEIEKSAYKYVIESRKGGDMHKRVSKGDEPLHTADLIESFVVTPDKLEQMGLRPDALPLGWWIGMKVNDDDQWAKVKSKERLGFSIHGTGSRSEMAA